MGQVMTSDGTRLNYEDAGSGRPLVMIPGWSQAVAQLKHQLSGLSDRLPRDRYRHAWTRKIG